MYSKIQLIAGLAAATAVGLTALAWYVSTSAAFLWGIFPEKPFQLVLETDPKTLPLISSLAQKISLTHRLPFPIEATNRLLYAEGGDERVVVVVPHLRQYRSVKQALDRSGWDTHRLGWVIVGQQGGKDQRLTQMLRAGLQQFYTQLVVNRLPLRPAVILVVSPSTYPSLTHPWRLVGTWHGQSLAITAKDAREWPDRLALPSLPSPGSLWLYGDTSQALNILPKTLQDNWETYVRKQLQITQTKPDIILAIQQFESFLVIQDNQSFTFGLKGSVGPAKEHLERWLAADAAAQNPVTRAFRLPDGTLGYEKQPGSPPVIFDTGSGLQNCYSSQNLKQSWVLCSEADWTFLTNKPNFTSLPVTSRLPQVQWEINLPNSFLKPLEFLKASQIRAYQNLDNQVNLIVEFKT